MSGAKSATPTEKVSFGHDALAEQLIKRIKAHFKGHDAIKDSLAIGIFGEWGSGKSHLLKLIEKGFPQKESEQDDIDKKQPPVVTISFNPWRYEKEEHLLIPLFKTMELSLENYIDENEGFLKKAGVEVGTQLKKATRFMGLSSLAFLQAFNFKYKIADTFEVDADIKKVIDSLKTDLPEKEPVKTPLQSLESFYFEFEHKLKAYTSGKDSFHLLFLIDDLDRCLPEKAVEMLEAIKLFLDVEGCAFVLALDDEVVERGIMHRYRDYLFQQQDKGQKEKPLAQLPITGMEYLEKIIHLPFRLPQPTQVEIKQFLLNKYGDLFGFEDQKQSKKADTDSQPFSREAAMLQHDHELLELFVKHIPPIPRKQIRMAELFQLMQSVVKSRRCEQYIKPLPLAELTMLQLFAPELYRFGRRKYQTFMKKLNDWSKEDAWAQRDYKSVLKAKFEAEEGKVEEGKKQKELTKAQQLEKRNYDRIYMPLLDILEEVSHSRSGFDPFTFIEESTLPSVGKDIKLYFSLVEEIIPQTQPSAVPEQEHQEYHEVVRAKSANITNRREFLDLLFGSSEGDWQSAMTIPELSNRVFADEDFAEILQLLDDSSLKQNIQGKETAWLSLVLANLTPEQFTQLKRRELFKPFFQVDDNIRSDMDKILEKARLLHRMTKQQRSYVSESISAIQKQSKVLLEDKKLDIKEKAKAGQILGLVGDDRTGVGIKETPDGKRIPDIDWMFIPAEGKSFEMGSNEYDDEKPTHTQKMAQNYSLSRYPVTNAQYACFIADKGYEADELWTARGREWKKADNITLPRYWQDEKWNNPNHPVVGVSWFEAMAFANWLNQFEVSGKVQLPTEREWEFAARGENSSVYPWGDWEEGHANTKELGLGKTSSVGMFSHVKSPYDVEEMAGNVREWTHSQWGKDWEKPEFAYPYDKSDGREDEDESKLFVLRGGSWSLNNWLARSSDRGRSFPANGYDYIGFRVLLSLASDS